MIHVSNLLTVLNQYIIKTENSSLQNRTQTGSEVHAASYPMGLSAVKMTSHLHLATRLRMHGAIPPPLTHTS